MLLPQQVPDAREGNELANVSVPPTTATASAGRGPGMMSTVTEWNGSAVRNDTNGDEAPACVSALEAPNLHANVPHHRLFGIDLTDRQALIVAHAFIALNQLLYAVYSVWSQWTLRYLAAEFLLLTRLTAAAAQIWAVSLWMDERSEAVNRQPFAVVWGSWVELAKVYVIGSLAFVVNVYCYLHAIQDTNAVVTTVAQCAVPVLTSTISIALGYEPFSWPQVVGLTMAIGGNVVQLNVWESGALGSRYREGIAEIAGNVLSYSLFLVFSKPFLRRLPTPIVYRHMILAGVGGFLVLCLTVTDIREQFLAVGNLNGWAMGGFIFSLVIMSYVPYATVGFALRSGVPSPLIAAHIVYQPVFAAIVGAVALGTVLRWYQYVGGAVAASAVGVTVWTGLQAQLASLPESTCTNRDEISPTVAVVTVTPSSSSMSPAVTVDHTSPSDVATVTSRGNGIASPCASIHLHEVASPRTC